MPNGISEEEKKRKERQKQGAGASLAERMGLFNTSTLTAPPPPPSMSQVEQPPMGLPMPTMSADIAMEKRRFMRENPQTMRKPGFRRG